MQFLMNIDVNIRSSIMILYYPKSWVSRLGFFFFTYIFKAQTTIGIIIAIKMLKTFQLFKNR